MTEAGGLFCEEGGEHRRGCYFKEFFDDLDAVVVTIEEWSLSFQSDVTNLKSKKSTHAAK